MADDLTPKKIKKYGWKPDFPDKRDLKFKFTKEVFPLVTVMLTDKYNFSKPYDQGNLGSCTANGIAFLDQFWFLNKSATPNPSAKVFMPSRLFIYWWERFVEHTVPYDAGAQIRDGIKVLARKGACEEEKWPYDIGEFATKPNHDAIKQARRFQALEYKRLDGTNKGEIVAALVDGHPVVFGFTVYESFESQEVADTGIVPMPQQNESILGGHCVVIVGYNAEEDYFLIRNSWGENWGINGYFKMPGAYVSDGNLCDDFWIITKMEVSDQ